MRWRFAGICFGLLFMAISLAARPPQDHEPNQEMSDSRNLDTWTYIDANNLLMFATNQGSLAEDREIIFGRNQGLYFPYQGSCSTLTQDPHTVLYSACLFMGGVVNGDIRVAVGAFDTPEYVQGPMDQSGDTLPDDPRFKVYKITSDSSVWLDPAKPDCARNDSMYHYDDYILWQTPEVLADGAPLDEYGNPLLKGKQTLWTVFNDAGEHNCFAYGGGTEPLGVEVQELIWASQIPGEENEIYIQYLFINKGGNVIEDFYVSFWADPDIGEYEDDLVGCDSARGIFYCYNADIHDNIYGPTPPAWGGQFLYGLVVPSPGDSAYFNGEWRQDYRNLRMTSFNRFIGWADPGVPAQVYGYMQGFDAVAQCPTCPYIDPITGLPTKFPYYGNPLTGSGWLDSAPSDRRLMANCGPVTFNPGDTQQVLIKIAAAGGANFLYSLCNLLNILDSACSGMPEYVPIDSMTTYIDDNGLREVFFSGEPRWISWIDWGGGFFGGSTEYGWNFWGGYLNPETMPDSFSRVEIRFVDMDTYAGQRAYRFCRGCIPNYSYLDYAWVPFQAWDTDDNRQLNACFVEWTDSDVFDGTWGPDNSGVGGREYLFILKSDYDGDHPSDAGTGSIDYPAMDFYDGSAFDILYAGWYRVRDGYTLDDMDFGQKLVFDWQDPVNFDPYADSILFAEAVPGDSTYQKLRLTASSDGLSTINLILSDPGNFSISPATFDIFGQGTETIRVYFQPQSEGKIIGYLDIYDNFNSSFLARLKLIGSTVGFTSTFVQPDPIYMMYKYTYGDTMTVEIFLPDEVVEYSIFDINLSSITINGLTPQEILVGENDTLGDYLKISVNIVAFIDSYPLLWDTTGQSYSVNGQLIDQTPFEEIGTVTMIGHRSGDANYDGRVNIIDVTYILDFIYSDGPEPQPIADVANVNGDQNINILDVLYLISYLYKDGSPPIPPEG